MEERVAWLRAYECGAFTVAERRDAEAAGRDVAAAGAIQSVPSGVQRRASARGAWADDAGELLNATTAWAAHKDRRALPTTA
jgi:hypothetical protein